jgi:hypothetical protein
MKIELTEVYGFKAAIRAMRNPMNSWERSDTQYQVNSFGSNKYPIVCVEGPLIGPQDMGLLLRLIKAGPEHRKALRIIHVWVDLVLARYLWQELDTYKISTVRNSCSTMHKLGTSPLEEEDFQDGHVQPDVLNRLNDLSKQYRETKDYDLVRTMKKELPEGFLQRATYNCNYENILSMLGQRHNHRLAEWSGKDPFDPSLCEWMLSLPYMKEFVSVFESQRIEQ